MRLRLLLTSFLGLATVLAAVRPLAEPDEGRYAEAAREILAGGRLLPTQNGVVYPDKPPGAYWCMDAAFLAVGTSAFAARLPALAALLATLGLVAAASRRGPAGTRGLAALVFLSSPLALVLGQLATLDMLLSALVTGAILAAHRWLHGGKVRDGLVAGLLLGAGFLVKGPVAWLLPLAILVVAGLLERPRPGLGRVLHPVLWIPASLVGLSWFAAAASREPALLDFWWFRETLGRVAEDVHGRRQPLWFFPGLALAATFPWLGWATARWLRGCRLPRRRAGQPPVIPRLWLVWGLLPVFLFSLPSSKQPAYLAPALPGLALSIGAALAAMRRRDAEEAAGVPPGRAALLGVLLLVLQGGAAIWFLGDEERTRSYDGFALALEDAAGDWAGAQLMGWAYGLAFRLQREDLVGLGPPPKAWSWAMEQGRVDVPATDEERLAAAGAFLAAPRPAFLLVHELHHLPWLEARLASALREAGASAWVWRRSRRALLLANRPRLEGEAPYAPSPALPGS